MGLRSVHPVLGISSDTAAVQGGFRTALPFFNAGRAVAGTQGGFRTALPSFPGAREVAATNGGFRSLMGFWIGGATRGPELIGRPPAGRPRKREIAAYVLPYITEVVDPKDEKLLVTTLRGIEQVLDKGAAIPDIEKLLRDLKAFLDKYKELYQVYEELALVRDELEQVIKVKKKQRRNQQVAILLLRR